MTPNPADAAQRLEAKLSAVAEALFRVDSSADLLFVRAQAGAGNRAAARAVASLAAAWEQYPLAKDAVERLTGGLARGDHAAVDAALGPAAVAMAGGTTTSISALLGTLLDVAQEVATAVTAMADAARQSLSQLESARTAARDLQARASLVGAGHDPEFAALQAGIDEATAAIATDPAAAPDLGELDRLVAGARARVESVEGHRDSLPADLGAARAQLAAIEALASEGADSMVRARARIAEPAGLLTPLDPARGGNQALRPWLARIEGESSAGAWESAANALVAWRRAAEAWQADVSRVAVANGAPLARRNELRGLLDAYRAKAQAFGRDEDGVLTGMHTCARDVLYAAPCDLDRAERLVGEYVEAVNTAARGGEA